MIGPEHNYLCTEKLVIAMIMIARKLRPFKENLIKILIGQLLKNMMQKYNCPRTMLLWAMELSIFDIEYILGLQLNHKAY